MNGIVTAHRELNGKIQTVIGTIVNTNIAGIRNALLQFMNSFLEGAKPATVSATTYFTEDSELITPSAKTDHSYPEKVRVYFTVTVEDSIDQFAKTYMLYADINRSSPADPAGYTEMNAAFKDAQYQQTGITKHELNGTGVFVDTIVFKL